MDDFKGSRGAFSTDLAELPRISLAAALAMIFIGMSGGCVMVVMPGVLAALGHLHDLSAAAVAFIASSEMAGLTIGTLGISLVIATVDRRRLAVLALAVLTMADLASTSASTSATLITYRLIAGMCEGVCIAVMTACVAGTPQPDSLFAIYMSSNLALSTVLLIFLGRFVTAGITQAVFLLLVGLCAMALATSRWLPPPCGPVTVGSRRVAHPDRQTSRSALLGLTGTLIMFMGIGGTWPLVGQLGMSLTIAPQIIARSLSAAAAMGIVAGLLVFAVGDRLGRGLPLAFGTLLLGATMVGLAHVSSASGFGVGVCAYMFLMVLIVPYYTGILAAIDAGGRMASFSMGIQFFGFAVGPLLAAPLLRHGFALSLQSAAALCIPAITLMLAAERRT